jgi:hypothetical protein
MLERRARDKHSSLLRKSVNYGRTKFYNIGPRPQCYITFFGLIYTAISIPSIKTEGTMMIVALIMPKKVL